MADTGAISFSGIASGLDTNAIIASMLKVDQARIDGLKSQRVALDTQISAVGQLRSKIVGFQGKLDALRFQSQLFTRSAATDTPSGQPAVVNVTASSAAQVGTFKVWVDQLATATRRVGGASIGDPTFAPGNSFATSGLTLPPTAGTFTINGVSIDATGVTDINGFVSKINAQTGATNVQAALVDEAGNPSASPTRIKLSNADGSFNAISLGSAGDTSNFLTAMKLSTAVQAPGTDNVVSTDTLGRTNPSAALQNARLAAPVAGTGTFTINGVAISWDASVDTLSTIVGKINGSTANVTASYDAVSDQVTLTSKQTGAQSISVADTSGTLMASLKLNAGFTETLGANAKYRIDTVAGGAQQVSTSNQISGVVTGVTLDLKQAQPATPVTVTVSQDATKPLAAMKDVVSALNDLQDFIRTNTNNDKDGNPGALKGNLGVRLLGDSLRRMMTDLVSGLSGPYKSMGDIGVSTGAVGSAVGTTNSFVIDDAKFSSALAANAQAVYDVLNNSVVGNEGVFTRLRSYLTSATLPGGLVAAADSSATARESDIDRQVSRLTDSLASKQQRLKAQFAAMEAAVAQLQAQGQRMQSQLGAGK